MRAYGTIAELSRSLRLRKAYRVSDPALGLDAAKLKLVIVSGRRTTAGQRRRAYTPAS